MTTADETHKEYEFTAQELDVIFGICSCLPNREDRRALQDDPRETLIKSSLSTGSIDKVVPA